MPLRAIAVLTAALAAASAVAAPQPRLAIGPHRAICLDGDAAIPDAIRDTVASFLRRQLAAATRGEAVVVGSAACNPAQGDVVVRLSWVRAGDRPLLGLTATDGQASYQDEVSQTSQLETDALALADRLFHSLKFEPHE